MLNKSTVEKILNDNEQENWSDKAKTLSEALPFMSEFSNSIFVIKYGGNAMGDDSLSESFARDIVLLKQVGIHPIVVHGGGPQIGKMLERLKIKSEFIEGLRVTDKSTVEIVEMVLSGSINSQVVASINKAGGKAIGLSGKDTNLIKAKKLNKKIRKSDSNIEKTLDLGFVGEPVSINPEVLHTFIQSDFIPVIAPIGIGEDGQTYNINADTAAGALASALKAKRFFLLTDVPGVLNNNKELLSEINLIEARSMIHNGTIHGGMIPKIETCLSCVESGVDSSVIIDGRVPHSLLLEVFTEDSLGTQITS